MLQQLAYLSILFLDFFFAYFTIYNKITFNKMICFVCNVILTSGKPWGYHHVVPKAFNEAREQGCAFCARLGHPPTGHSSTLEGGAFYRWTIREAAKVEEQQDCLVVSFRSASTDNALANAIFYLLPQYGK